MTNDCAGNFTVISANTACRHNNKKLRIQTFRKCRYFFSVIFFFQTDLCLEDAVVLQEEFEIVLNNLRYSDRLN